MAGNGLHKSKAYLYKRYVQEKKSINEIAEECGVSYVIIYAQLNKYGLRR